MMIDIVITGLFREKELFKKSLDIFSKIDKVDNIIFSTWKNHLSKEDLIFLKQYNINVIETEPLKENGPGNIYSQMKSLEIGLKYCKNDHVLKTRSDLLIGYNLLNDIFNKEPVKLDKDIFKEKIWTYWFDITTPFYLSEECFYGHIDDIKKLYNYDKTFDDIWYYQAKNGYGGATHQRRYIYPFLNIFDFNKWIYENKTLLKRYQKHYLYKEFEHDDFLELISKYYFILDKYFWIYNPRFEVINKGRFGCIDFCKIDFDDYDKNLTSSKMILRDVIICNNSKLITNIKNNKYNGIASKISKKINFYYENN